MAAFEKLTGIGWDVSTKNEESQVEGIICSYFDYLSC